MRLRSRASIRTISSRMPGTWSQRPSSSSSPSRSRALPTTSSRSVSDADANFVRLEGVTKRFGELVVLRNVDLNVDLHQVVCLIGASGSGKSTLLRCINLLERVEEGTIAVDGQVITNG